MSRDAGTRMRRGLDIKGKRSAMWSDDAQVRGALYLCLDGWGCRRETMLHKPELLL